MFIITGGGSGIGKALALELAKRYKAVLIIGRREQCLIETAKHSPLIDYVCADISLAEGRQQILAHLETQPIIEGLIHNAAIIDPILPITTIDENSWRQVMATNVDAPLFLSQLLYKKLTNGRVLHIGSGAAYFPLFGWTAYCTSKAALSMITRCWQLESDIVAFASVMPGIIDTDMQAQIRRASHMDTEKLSFFKQLYENKQLVSAETVAMFLSWLLLDIDSERYVSQEWDIYDESHHNAWLIPPYTVPPVE